MEHQSFLPYEIDSQRHNSYDARELKLRNSQNKAFECFWKVLNKKINPKGFISKIIYGPVLAQKCLEQSRNGSITFQKKSTFLRF